jgi:predicted RNA-binding protein with PIN domain
VLTGSALTDTKITLVAGKAHLKHTEGGDFREATLRAVRHGLMKAGCTLLEPYYKFRIEVPTQNVGRAMADLQSRSAEFEVEAADGEFSVIKGRAPVSELHDYAADIISYTRGRGSISCASDGYEPCHNEDVIVSDIAYDPEADLENTPHSVFCAGGAGFTVPWSEVDAHKHLDSDYVLQEGAQRIIPKASGLAKKYSLGEDELKAIMSRIFGPEKPRVYSERKVVSATKAEKPKKKAPVPQKRLTIVDGYNVIFSWESLKSYAKTNLDDARKSLMDTMSNYVAFTKTELVLIFDAYLVKDGRGSDFETDGYRVIFTKEDITADAYIEKMMHDLGPDYSVRVVTGDRMVQNAAVCSGILRMTPAEFESEVAGIGKEIDDFIDKLASRRMAGKPTVK